MLCVVSSRSHFLDPLLCHRPSPLRLAVVNDSPIIASDAPSQLHVLGLYFKSQCQAPCRKAMLPTDGNAICVEGTKIDILEERHDAQLCCFVQRFQGRRMEATILFESPCDPPHQALEQHFFYKQILCCLIAGNLAERLSTGTESLGLCGYCPARPRHHVALQALQALRDLPP